MVSSRDGVTAPSGMSAMICSQGDGPRTNLVDDALEDCRRDAPVDPLDVTAPLPGCVHVLDELRSHVRAELDHLSGCAVASEAKFNLCDALPHLQIVADLVLSELGKLPRAQLLALDHRSDRSGVQL